MRLLKAVAIGTLVLCAPAVFALLVPILTAILVFAIVTGLVYALLTEHAREKAAARKERE